MKLLTPGLTAVCMLFALLPSCAGSSWSLHHDPAGFSVDLPAGWKARPDSASGRVDIASERARVSILPLFVKTAVTPSVASATLSKLTRSTWPEIQWTGRPQPAGANAVRISNGSSGAVKAAAVLAWTSTPAGAAAFLYMVEAPRVLYSESEIVFSRILGSFRVIGRGQAPAAASRITYARWTDPRENAFSVETPTGWRTSGGLARLSAVDPRVVWSSASPDGSIRMMFGDAGVPVFTMPNQMLMMTGFREGSWYSPGYGVRMLVRRFSDGLSFAREYTGTRIAQVCPQVTLKDERNRADAVSALNRIYAQYGLMTQLSAGEVAFSCEQNGSPMSGYFFAATRMTGATGSGIWNAEYLFGYLAAEGKTAQASEAMSHALASSTLNPDWVAMQQGLTSSVSQIVSQTQSEISRLITESYWNRTKNESEMSRRQSNATLGVVDVIDPETGREYKVENGSNYHWIDNRGRIIGTQTDTTPNVDFRQLVTLP